RRAGQPSNRRPSGQRLRQLVEAADLGVGLRFALPGKAAGVVPDGPQAGFTGALDVIPRMIANMYRLMGGHPGAAQCLAKRQWVGLAHAEFLGAQGKPEISARPRRRTSALPLVSTAS